MNATLSKALVALVPVGVLFVGSVLLFVREKAFGSFLWPGQVEPCRVPICLFKRRWFCPAQPTRLPAGAR